MSLLLNPQQLLEHIIKIKECAEILPWKPHSAQRQCYQMCLPPLWQICLWHVRIFLSWKYQGWYRGGVSLHVLISDNLTIGQIIRIIIKSCMCVTPLFASIFIFIFAFLFIKQWSLCQSNVDVITISTFSFTLCCAGFALSANQVQFEFASSDIRKRSLIQKRSPILWKCSLSFVRDQSNVGVKMDFVVRHDWKSKQKRTSTTFQQDFPFLQNNNPLPLPPFPISMFCISMFRVSMFWAVTNYLAQKYGYLS